MKPRNPIIFITKLAIIAMTAVPIYSTDKELPQFIVESISNETSETSSAHNQLINPMALGLAEDSFFQGATVNKINRTMKKQNNREERIRDKQKRRMKILKDKQDLDRNQEQSRPVKNAFGSEKNPGGKGSRSVNSFGLKRPPKKDNKLKNSLLRSEITTDLRSAHSVVNIGSIQSIERDMNKGNRVFSKSVTYDLDEDVADNAEFSNEDSEEMMARKIDLTTRDRIHAAPDTYEGTEATKKRFSRIFSRSPSTIVPVIRNCNRSAVEYFFKRVRLQDVDDSLLDPERPVNEHNLEITDRLDADNVDFCPYMEMACCTNDEMDAMREIVARKEARLARFERFVNKRHFDMFEKDMITTAKVFLNEDEKFLSQCLNDDSEFVRSILSTMSTTVFENGLRVTEMINRLRTLDRYMACKICDGSDNHRTLKYKQGKLTVYITPEMALHLVQVKLLELRQAVYIRKISIISRLVQCKMRRRSTFGLNEAENGAVRWTQNFYRKCRGELVYTLSQGFESFNDLLRVSSTEDLNEYMAYEVNPVKLRSRKKDLAKKGIISLKDIGEKGNQISYSCQQALFSEDSLVINFRDSFDMIELTEINFQIISRFWKFLQGRDVSNISDSDWIELRQNFDFNLGHFLDLIRDPKVPEHSLGLMREIREGKLLPFVFSILSSEDMQGSQEVSLGLSENGVEYDMMMDYERIVSKRVVKLWVSITALFVLVFWV